MFPDNFVKVQKQTKKSIPPPPPSIKPKKEVKIFVAAYTYDAANKDELSFKEGQKIEFIEDLEDGWATGKLLDNGIIGLYPTNFVEIISKNTADDGWWEGEVNGKKGVFPKNFIETTPSAPPSATSSGGGKSAGSGLASPSSDF